MKKIVEIFGWVLMLAGIIGIIYFRFINPSLTETQNLMTYWWGYVASVVSMFIGYLLLVFYGGR